LAIIHVAQRFQPAAVFGWLFLMSGASALGCQVIWARMLGASIGQELPAALGVVTAFMAGLGIGAKAGGVVARSGRNPIRLYAGVELLLAVWVVASIWILRPGAEALTAVVGLGASPSLHWLASFLAAGLLLLPGTIAMGSTLVLAERGLSEHLAAADQAGRLYAWNTAGGVVGLGLASLWLMPSLGFARSLGCLAVLNAAAGVAAWVWIAPRGATTGRKEVAEPESAPRMARLAYVGFLSGLGALGYESVGFRLLSHFLDNTIHTFATVLALFLGGTAAGAWAQQGMPRWGVSAFAHATAVGMGFSIAAFRLLIPTLEEGALGPGWSNLAAGMTLFLLPCLGMGAFFARLAREAAEVKGGLPRLLWINSLGSAAGPVAFGAFAVSAMGYQATLVTLGLAYSGMAILAATASIRLRWLWTTAAILAISLSSLDLGLQPTREGEKVVFERTGLMAGVAVVESADGHRVLRVNNRFQMGGTAAAIAEQRHADIPLLLHPSPRSLLMLGLGTGISLSAAAHHPGLEAVGVEIIPEVLEAAPFFKDPSEAELSSKPPMLAASDARRFARKTSRRFDVVVGDLFHPAVDGAGFLYTVEHFQAARGVLNEGGIFCQWLPLFQMGEPVARSVARSFLDVFPEAELWLLRPNVDLPVVGLIGRLSRPEHGPDWVEDKARQSPTLAAHLRKVGLGDSLRLFGSFMAGPKALTDWAGGARMNTDDLPVVLFEAPRHLAALRARREGTFASLRRRLPREPDWSWSGGLAEALGKYGRARESYLDGALLELKGDFAEAVALYLRSAGESSDFTTSYARVLTMAAGAADLNPSLARDWLGRLEAAQPGRGVALELLRRLEAAAPPSKP